MEEDKGNKQESNAFATEVYTVPGEPAVVINGVPEIVGASSIVSSCDTLSVFDKDGNMGLGDWFVGRDIQKLFMGSYYSGKVTEYDKENGWYRVKYEDGDTEDLDWLELKEVLRPMDVTVSLKTLVNKVIRNHTKKSKHKARN
ncbi:dirigent protein 17-like [Vicia villosa]|uniref:dirigent protein 17-like n=1 Tax=Vicia villosa TaxID=3911 RepID=UPI00273C41BA|nr:dirigent protein 17-like [Vicia villosa]